jgi:hypothetical protein
MRKVKYHFQLREQKIVWRRSIWRVRGWWRVVTFFGSKIGQNLQLCGGRIIVQQEKISRVECSWSNPTNPLLLYEILHLLFFPPVRILCALQLESRKKLSAWPWRVTFGNSVSSGEVMSHQPNFSRQVVTSTLSKINKRNSVCDWMLVDST